MASGLQSGIGQFVIGESAIGVGASFDIDKTVISQYANSPTLVQIIENYKTYLDQNPNIDAFFDMMWNIDTAVGYGLDVWGRIVGVERTQQVTTPQFSYFFGFGEPADPYITGFGQSQFYLGGGTSGGIIVTTYTLTDAEFRTLILAKAAANISDGSVRSMNQVLISLFPGRGRCYVQDNLNMSLTYVFEFELTPAELVTVQQSGVLPRPTGVKTSFVTP